MRGENAGVEVIIVSMILEFLSGMDITRRVAPTTGDGKLLRLIAVFKLFKAGLLLASLATLSKLIHHGDPTHTVIAWAMRLHVDPGNRYLGIVLEKILDLNGPQLEVVAAGTVVYAALFAAEGVGLLFEMTWAEYLTLVETAGFVPIELYEIIQRVSTVKCAVLLLNVAVIIYLARCVQRPRRSAGLP
ncbi:MAG: DUF2127 domain-containing protein [Candidatus Binatia bacterium]